MVSQTLSTPQEPGMPFSFEINPGLPSTASWPVDQMLIRLILAVGLGAFIGLEREQSRKTGVRTFALVALAGALSGMLGAQLTLLAGLFLTVLTFLMNWRELKADQSLSLTTSVALLLVFVCGILCGLGHVSAPVAVCTITAGLLAFKKRIHGFAGGLTESEVRSAILLAVLTFVILPVLPENPVDPWNLIRPRENWLSVVAIAAIGFVNYILLKTLGSRGMEFTAFFGGLVNSRQVVVELTSRLKQGGEELAPIVSRSITLATAAMLVRNAIIVGVFNQEVLKYLAIPFLTIFAAAVLIWWHSVKTEAAEVSEPLAVDSPFSLTSALKFGLVFLAINIVAGITQRAYGNGSFYVISILGGFFSSGSAIAAAGNLLNQNQISVMACANGVILSSLTSILANIPFLLSQQEDVRRKAIRMLIIFFLAGAAAMVLNQQYFASRP
ncbi:MgtC/SapB family protein [Planctomicrobium sp. SH664]|uniref:MgtC/SapB family protein n=1 Tax=Planctomicrobium sp. SH664 TaxID=3448125 RepID=UPI003F5B7A20